MVKCPLRKEKQPTECRAVPFSIVMNNCHNNILCRPVTLLHGFDKRNAAHKLGVSRNEPKVGVFILLKIASPYSGQIKGLK